MVQPSTFFGLRQLRSTISEHHEIQEEFSTNAVQAVTGCTGTRITPTCLANLYNFATAKVQTVDLLGIAGFLEEYAIKADFTTFLNSYAFFANKAKTFKCTVVNGGSCPSSPPGIEANLDVQYAGSISTSVPNTYYSTAGRGQWIGSGTNTNEPYLEFLNYLLALPSASLPTPSPSHMVMMKPPFPSPMRPTLAIFSPSSAPEVSPFLFLQAIPVLVPLARWAARPSSPLPFLQPVPGSLLWVEPPVIHPRQRGLAAVAAFLRYLGVPLTRTLLSLIG